MPEKPELPEPDGVIAAAHVGHRNFVAAGLPLEAVQREFVRTGVDFLAVIEGEKLLGACARRDVADALGARFGFALNAQRPVRFFLMSRPLVVAVGHPLAEVFQSLAARGDRDFFDDVLLVDAQGGWIGLVYVHTLVRLQTGILVGNIVALEASRREIVEQNRRMEDDLRMAREVQLALMPLDYPPVFGQCGTLRLAHHYQPSGGVSGDFFDALVLSECAVALLICDVMGHGVRSALITAMLRAMVEELRPIASDPAALLTRMNADLTRLLRRTGDMIFVTVACIVADAGEGKLRYAIAGHPVPLHARAGEALAKPLRHNTEIVGPALGLLDDFVFAAGATEFGRGDRVLLYTDGIYEAADAAGEEFGPERLAAALTAASTQPLTEVIPSLMAAAEKFSGTRTFADDVCLLAVELAAGAT